MRARLPLRRKRNCTPLSGKRLLALWNTLPGVEKRREVGDREALIDQLWSAVEALPEPEPLFWKRDSKFESDSLQGRVVRTSNYISRSDQGLNRLHQARIVVLYAADARADRPADHPLRRVRGEQRFRLRRVGRFFAEPCGPGFGR